jgi:hypothetical protein
MELIVLLLKAVRIKWDNQIVQGKCQRYSKHSAVFAVWCQSGWLREQMRVEGIYSAFFCFFFLTFFVPMASWLTKSYTYFPGNHIHSHDFSYFGVPIPCLFSIPVLPLDTRCFSIFPTSPSGHQIKDFTFQNGIFCKNKSSQAW